MENYLTKLDRSVLTVGTLDQDSLEETRFWLSKPPVERLIALELLRMRFANYDNTSARLQRFYTVTERQ
ncbi:MAG TPA: hypothetical protein PK228_00680 [Saprospiraceae bacterium]|nr:hypothetical protein [Saprospiraceae bacterium]